MTDMEKTILMTLLDNLRQQVITTTNLELIATKEGSTMVQAECSRVKGHLTKLRDQTATLITG